MTFPADLAAWDPARLADQIDEASQAADTPARPGHLPAVCECGHAAADHRAGLTLAPRPHGYRVCLVDGCDCQELNVES